MSTSRITNVIEHLGFVRKGTNFKDDEIWDKYIEKFMMHYKEATPAMLRRAICSILTGKKEGTVMELSCKFEENLRIFLLFIKNFLKRKIAFDAVFY